MTVVLLAGVALAVPAAAADAPVPPAPDCADATTGVLVDASSEPDLYAAYLLAGVLGTGCIVDAGDRGGPLPEASAALIEGITTGYAVGGVVAVPAAKLAAGDVVGGKVAVPPAKLDAHISWRRAGGADRWATLDIIGRAAADPTTLPAVVTGFTAIASGEKHACALHSDGTIVCWGSYGPGGRTKAPMGTFTAISAGGDTCALRTDGTIACWGDNSWGVIDGPA